MSSFKQRLKLNQKIASVEGYGWSTKKKAVAGEKRASELANRVHGVRSNDLKVNFHDDVEHREMETIKRNDRRALKTAAGGSYTPEQWQSLLASCGNACCRCGDNDDLTVDHIKPIYLGGTNSIENLQVLCRSCNSSKGTKTIDYRPKA